MSRIRKHFFSPLAGLLLALMPLSGCGGHGGGSAPPAASSAASPVSFWAADFTADPPLAYQVSAAKVAEGSHCYVYLEAGQSVSQDKINAIVNEFDNTIYPADTSTFGSEPNPGVDNDSRITILLLDIKDGFNGTTRTTYIAGYFDPANEYASPGSNRREMFYMDTNPGNPASVRFYSTLAHEFQHMIHWEQKDHLRGVADDTWINEGMSEIAPVYCGYGPSYNRVLVFENAPGDSLVGWNSAIPDYGVVYMWAQYFKDRFDGTQPNIFRSMLQNNLTGVGSVDSALSLIDPSLTFASTFRDWALAIYSGKSTVWAAHPEWSYTSIDTKAGTYGGIRLPGLFPQSTQNPASLPALSLWSLGYYSYTPVSGSTGTLTWTAAAASERAALADPSPAMRPDLVSGQAYTFSTVGYLILENPAGVSAGAGDSVSLTSLLDSGSQTAGADVRTPKAMLEDADRDPKVQRLIRETGEPEAVCIHPYLVRKERALKAKGMRPQF